MLSDGNLNVEEHKFDIVFNRFIRGVFRDWHELHTKLYTFPRGVSGSFIFVMRNHIGVNPF